MKRLGHIFSDTVLDLEFKLSWCSQFSESANAKEVILKELESLAVSTSSSTNEVSELIEPPTIRLS